MTTEMPRSSGLIRWEPLIAASAFAVFVCLLGPWWSAFELDPDEGFNVMKAALVADGHAMYDAVWSDQPPLLTYVLTLVEWMFGPGIAWARAAVLVFASVLIAALFFIVRADFGRLGAWFACIVLSGGFLFQSLSVSVMIGLPAIALAMVSLAVVWRADADRAAVLVASGAVMALALQTKLFVATALPVALFAVALTGPAGETVGRRAARCSTWLGATVLSWALIAVASGLDPMAHLIAPHTEDSIAEAFTYDGGPARLWSLLSQQPHYLIAAAIGLVAAGVRHPHRSWAPVIWLIVGLIALVDHRPLWPHQLMLLFVPMAWLAGGVGPAMTWPVASGVVARARAGVAAVSMVAVVAFSVVGTGRTIERFHAPTDPLDAAAVGNLERHAGATRWIVTDSPLDAYYAGLKTPPELAVISLKRVKGGTLTPDDVLAVIQRLNPEQVSYRRMFMGKPVLAHLKEAYVQVPGTKRHALFVRSDIYAAPE